VPDIWNPLNGEVVAIPVYEEQGNYINIPVTLAPYGSYLVVFKKGNAIPHFTDVTSIQGANPPLMKFSHDGIIFLNEGNFELKSTSGTKQIESQPKIQVINGSWNVSFTKGWGAPDSAVFPELSSWTNNENPGIKYYSGIGTYHKTFSFNHKSQLPKNQKIFIDLGEISKVAEVWLNGRHLGITWAKPFKFDVTDFIKNGENRLIVKVANTWSNRLTGDALTGEKFTNTNISISRRGIKWADSPLIPSGLLGPVIIQSTEIFK
jgi:hypothetical protein